MTILESVYAGDSLRPNGQVPIHKIPKDAYACDMTDAHIFVCPSCKISWQKPITMNGEYFYYEDFPTIGKRRKLCQKCNS